MASFYFYDSLIALSHSFFKAFAVIVCTVSRKTTVCWSKTASKSQGIKQLMAGGGVVLIGTTLIPLLSGLFG